ncbi:MAG: phospho-N-acetylmuramoyl-pentapeptide-transferase [Epulopiscium sp.]|nr:phospho-N-acetylmuramoyl-pentapeptide-transferase [Candidatus Epulonipiscium sp.]
MSHESIYAVLIAFLLNIAISSLMIPYLEKLNLGQYVRDDGPDTHLKKAGTPTMGGIIILLSILITSLFFAVNNKEIHVVLFTIFGFGLIGFMDDYIKVIKKRSLGLKPMQKLIGQLFVAIVFGLLVKNYLKLDTNILLPFSGGKELDLGILYFPFLIFGVLGTVNAVNLTDGLDGLAAGVTVIVATFFTVVSWGVQSNLLPVSAAAMGSLLGFLLFNTYPAKVFMGDTGSLALGGFVVSAAFILKMPLFILIVGFIYVVENISVIIQVGYYKLTKKRIFKMAPIHHHFELSGWPETKIVTVFCIITAMMCLIGLIAM